MQLSHRMFIEKCTKGVFDNTLTASGSGVEVRREMQALATVSIIVSARHIIFSTAWYF